MACIENYDFCMTMGDDRTLTFRYKDSNGVPIDLTGMEFELQSQLEELTQYATVDEPETGVFKFVYYGDDLIFDGSKKTAKYRIVKLDSSYIKETLFEGKITLESAGW